MPMSMGFSVTGWVSESIFFSALSMSKAAQTARF
jgi:hypothetical protein